MSDPIFQRGLQDLIKGIRSHKKDPSAFISQAMASIKIELRSTDPFLKTEAVSFWLPFRHRYAGRGGALVALLLHYLSQLRPLLMVSLCCR